MPTDQATLAKYLTDALPITGPPEWEEGPFRIRIIRREGDWYRQVYEPERIHWAETGERPYSDHEALCLWQNHTRGWLGSNTHQLEERSYPSAAAVTVWAGLEGTCRRFPADTIDAALIAAVVWVHGKGESDAATDTKA